MDDEPRRSRRQAEDEERAHRPAWAVVLAWHMLAFLVGFFWLRYFAAHDRSGRGAIVFVYGFSGIFFSLFVAASVAALIDDRERSQARSTFIGSVTALAALAFVVVMIAGSLEATAR